MPHRDVADVDRIRLRPLSGQPSGARAWADQQKYCDIPALASLALPRLHTFYTGPNRGRSAKSARSLLTELFCAQPFIDCGKRHSDYKSCIKAGRYSTVTGRWSEASRANVVSVTWCARSALVSSPVTRMPSMRRLTPCAA